MPIATRTLTLRQEGKDLPVAVRVFAPEPMDETQDAWSCPFEIDWPTGAKRLQAGGVDAVQALEIALQMIGALLYASDYHENGALRWLDEAKGYGFPIPKNMRDQLVGIDTEFC